MFESAVRHARVVPACFVALTALLSPASRLDAQAGADTGGTRLLREPTVSATQVAFEYGGDLWVVGRTGGEARRLTSTPAIETDPHFSPDGKWVAFTSNRTGSPQVWVVSSEGGEPRRLTWHPSPSYARGWTPDGREVLYASDRGSAPVPYAHLWLVPRRGRPATRGPRGHGLPRLLLSRRHAAGGRPRGPLGHGVPELPRRPEHAAHDPGPEDPRRDEAPQRPHHRHVARVARGPDLVPLRPRLHDQRVVVRPVHEGARPGHPLHGRGREDAGRRGEGRPRLRGGRLDLAPGPVHREGPPAGHHRARRLPVGHASLGGREPGDRLRLSLADRQAGPVRGARRQSSPCRPKRATSATSPARPAPPIARPCGPRTESGWRGSPTPGTATAS